jgi:hypothetical protein
MNAVRWSENASIPTNVQYDRTVTRSIIPLGEVSLEEAIANVDFEV